MILFLIGHPPRSKLFPYTTLFRSLRAPRLPSPRAAAAACKTILLPRPDSRRSAPPARRSRARRRRPTRVRDRKSTRLNSSHLGTSYAVFGLSTKTQDFEPATVTGA